MPKMMSAQINKTTKIYFCVPYFFTCLHNNDLYGNAISNMFNKIHRMKALCTYRTRELIQGQNTHKLI